MQYRNFHISRNTNNLQGFSIIEVLVGIFIFSMGLVSIYALLVTSLRINDYNSNAIIASNLAREQVELLRNMRDSNYSNLASWKSIGGGSLEAGKQYRLGQEMSSGDIIADEISPFVAGESELKNMQNYRVCLNGDNFYIYCEGNPGTKQTPFYKYISVEDATGYTNAYKITSKVIWYKRGYYEYDIKTILADWMRL